MHPEKDTAEAFLLRRAAKTGVPITGSFELTPLCNLNCKMCYVRMNRTEQEKISRLQTAEEWVALAEKLRDAGTLFLLLTGGEPLLYPAFRAVYLAVRKRGMIVTVNTNGTLLNEDWVAFFAKNPPRRVNVTLYGASGETYKSLCGDETGYAKAMRGIQLLQAHGVPVKVGVSVVRQNRHDLETLFQITKERNLELEPDTYMMSTESGQHEARLAGGSRGRKPCRNKNKAWRCRFSRICATHGTGTGKRCSGNGSRHALPCRAVFVCRRLARRFAPVRDARGAFRADRTQRRAGRLACGAGEIRGA